MSTYYSILFAPIRPNLSEQLSIGLMLKGEHGSYFAISSNKLGVVKDLLPEPAYKLLKTSLKNIMEEFENHNNSSSTLFAGNNVFEKLFSEQYLNYMSVYNNNLVTFTPATPIKLPYSKETFEALYKKFVDTSGFPTTDDKVEKEESLILNTLKAELYPKIIKRVNLDSEMKMDDYPFLLVQMQLNFMGISDIPISGFAADFQKPKQYLQNDISRYITFMKSFEINKTPGKHFLIANEPDKHLFKDQHTSWKHLLDSGIVDIVPVNETDRIVEYVEENDVKPFLV